MKSSSSSSSSVFISNNNNNRNRNNHCNNNVKTEEIDSYKKNGKFIAKNRYVYDEKYDTPNNWPIWPSNIYITSSPPLNSNLVFIPQSDVIYTSDTSDDSLIFPNNDIMDEPKYKRVRVNNNHDQDNNHNHNHGNMISNSQSSSESGDYDIDDIDCEILSCFFSFAEDELLGSDLLF